MYHLLGNVDVSEGEEYKLGMGFLTELGYK